MSVEQNAASLARLYEAFEEEGPAGAAVLIEQLFDPEVEFNTLQTGQAGGQTYRGLEGMAVFFSELHSELENVHYDAPQFHPVGEHLVVALTCLVGIERGTSIPVRQDLALVYRFDANQVVQVDAYETPADALEAAQRGHAGA